MVDKELTCMVVSVYNLAQGRGPIIGNSVAIPEPYMTRIDATYKTQVCFHSIVLLSNTIFFIYFYFFFFPEIPIPLYKS